MKRSFRAFNASPDHWDAQKDVLNDYDFLLSIRDASPAPYLSDQSTLSRKSPRVRNLLELHVYMVEELLTLTFDKASKTETQKWYMDTNSEPNEQCFAQSPIPEFFQSLTISSLESNECN